MEALNTSHKNLVTEYNPSKKITADIIPEPVVSGDVFSYNSNDTAVTIPGGHTGELKTTDCKSSVKTIYTGDLDALTNELPSADTSISNLRTAATDDATKLLSNISFAQTTNKK